VSKVYLLNIITLESWEEGKCYWNTKRFCQMKTKNKKRNRKQTLLRSYRQTQMRKHDLLKLKRREFLRCIRKKSSRRTQNYFFIFGMKCRDFFFL
jgi:hypothetical protein